MFKKLIIASFLFHRQNEGATRSGATNFERGNNPPKPWRRLGYITVFSLILCLAVTFPVDAALIDQVNAAFREVYGRNPTQMEWEYWASRVQRGEKTTYEALAGAMGYQKAQGTTSPTVVASTAPAVSAFKVDPKYYPSPHNPNFLPEGTLIKSPTSALVYYVRGGKKSWVLPGVLDRWLTENHFFKSDIILTIAQSDLDRYPTTSSVNKLYIGKVLQHPDGTQYFIDDKLRKRKLPGNIRTALRFPGGNLYKTSAKHLQEFISGPTLTDISKHPGGSAFYDGPFHGGRIWKTEEAAGGSIVKRLYLKDRFFEADGYPDESQRAPIDATMLARHTRGANIDRYPDGWLVNIGTNIYLMQGGKLRLIASPQIFAAMGYKTSHVRGEYPELYKTLAKGEPIRAFKNVIASGTAATVGAPAPAPNTATDLTKVRPHIRTIIGEMNTIYRSVFDREVTISENQFWVNYIYNGEVNTKEDLMAAMQRTKTTGVKPALTSRTAVLSEERLEQHWLSYLFYFVHQKEMSEDDKEYWYRRITPGDRDTIEKLGGTLQWIKDNYNGATHR